MGELKLERETDKTKWEWLMVVAPAGNSLAFLGDE